MVYRIHFTAQDLARTRVAETPRPLVELSAAMVTLQGRTQPVLLDAWRRRAHPRLSGEARMALSLVPLLGWSPGFLAPAEAGTPEEVLEQVSATPRQQIHADMAEIAEKQALPTWARDLADDATVRKGLYDGLSQLHALLLAPYWTQITDHFAADRTVRMRHLLSGGVERLLAQANPQWMRWSPPVLEIRTVLREISHDLHLEGRGLLLVPSVFLTSSASVWDHETSQPLVTYPVSHDDPMRRLTFLTPESAVPKTTAAVAALLGHTRAAVLNTVAEHPGCTTKELAALVSISPASASEHATVLREAGLIRTMRHPNTALHSPTGLGTALLNTSYRPSRH
ncbi:winged helix-turn-helix domain-containing protein [Streptomyces sp. GMY02]|uniref:winged helix-turn-helix domain-containing protein n=1 Tax=Streptomyces sp. GMY02 TaxID=1333528 RepID=UPI001C2BE82B|nr:winged helix-turn-helix domain-containing protein [Streptomyces sp. GMY02]QXE38063.1 winged helix-turn-helix domain-containing protein [Streptomyces sp. GMY02]